MTIDKEIELSQLAEIKHPYYCSSSNYYSNDASCSYETMTDFLDEWEGYDVDMNLCFRWDVYSPDESETEEFTAEIFIMLQRKGIFRPCSVASFKQHEVSRFMAYAKKHHDTIKQIWAPFD